MRASPPPVARRDRVAIGVTVALLVSFAVLAWRRRWMSDDGFIDLRVVQNIVTGHGPCFNPGERVEAYTNPLWVAVLSLVAIPLRATLADNVALPWAAVVLGLAFTVSALVLAAAPTILHPRKDSLRTLPLGLAVITALPPYWDFATSGLETGLSLLWLAGTFVALTAQRPGSRGFSWLAVLIGMGPLIRPDLAVFAVGAALAHLALSSAESRRTKAQWLAWCALPVVSYQVFRMGYFAQMVPATAIAKEASAARWDQGFLYFVDFARPYRLGLPLGALAVWKLWDLRRSAPDRTAWIVTATPVACALVHGAYIVRVGGDFMHARLLLPTLFGLLLPVYTVRGRPRDLTAVTVAVLGWALVCGLALRVPYDGLGDHGIADERAYYIAEARVPHPVRAEDDRHSIGVALARFYRESLSPARTLVYNVEDTAHEHRFFRLPLAGWVPSPLAGACREIGRCGFLSGPLVHIIDVHGLADVFAAHEQIVSRGRPGHEKTLPDVWLLARFTAEGVPLPPGGDDARAALACGDLATLQRAITAPLTLGRFVHNMALAPRLTALRIPASPLEARGTFCKP